MKHVKMCGLLVAMLALTGPVRATTVIDFEDWTGGSGQQWSLVSGGYDFHGNLAISSHPGTGNPTNFLYNAGESFKFGHGGQPFSVVSLDLQEGFADADTRSVRLAAYFAGGGWIEQTFTLDGIASTFQTFYPVGFLNLTQVFVYAYNSQGQSATGVSVDNIVVPEPSALVLFLVGTLGVCWRRSRP